MKRNARVYRFLYCFLVTLILAACGGGGGGDTPSGTKTAETGTTPTAVGTLTGIIADGYLREARVFLDRNGNRLYDNGEPTGMSGPGGIYALEVNPGEGDLYPVLAQVVAGQTVDEDSGQTVPASYLLETVVGRWQFVSPLSSLVKAEQEKNPAFSELQAVLQVRSQLGIADNVSLFDDYLALGTGGIQATDPQLAEEYTRTHKAAQIVAALMGNLRETIIQNLGGQITAEEQAAVVYMISDQILEQGDLIKQALDTERNGGAPIDIVTLVSIISTEINLLELDATLLAVYEQRISQSLPTWDMQSPVLLSITPPADDTASVDVTVGIVFDELLDETLITDQLINLSGPTGSLDGSVEYDAGQKKLSFTPTQLLLPFSSYLVTLGNELTDPLGNSLGEDVSWSFTTIFDQTPPALPDF